MSQPRRNRKGGGRRVPTGPLPNLIVVASPRAREEPTGEFLRLLRDNVTQLRLFQLQATRGTAERIYGTGLFPENAVEAVRPGRDGGLAQLAAMAARREAAAAILLLDPSDPWFDAVEYRALQRVCIQQEVRLMTTYAAAQRWLSLEAARPASKLRLASKPAPWKPSNWRSGRKNVTRRGIKYLRPRLRTIALISHDGKKLEMLGFVRDNIGLLALHDRILTTGTTGWLLRLAFGRPSDQQDYLREIRSKKNESRIAGVLKDVLRELERVPKEGDTKTLIESLQNELGVKSSGSFVQRVMPLPSGPLGGDVLIAEAVLANECHSIIFFHDTLKAHPHNDDIRLLEHTVRLPGVSAECVSDRESAERWIVGLKAEVRKGAEYTPNLAEELRQRYRLRDLVLVDLEEDEDGHELGKELARAAAGYFNQCLVEVTRKKEEVRIGLASGSTTLQVLMELDDLNRKNLLEKPPPLSEKVKWTPLIGTVRGEITLSEASIIAEGFCHFYGGALDGFPCGGFAQTKDTIPRAVRDLVTKLEEADIILTPAAPWDKNSSLYTNTGLNREYLPSTSKAEGIMSGVFFNKQGKEVQGRYATIGLGFGGFRRASKRGYVIVVCGGRRRRAVALAILRSRLASVLITTERTAKWIEKKSRK